MTTIGEVRVTEGDAVIEWEIKDFFSLQEDFSTEVDKNYLSPSFSFGNASWCFSIYYPNGERCQRVDPVEVFLRRESSGPHINLEFSLGLKARDGKIHAEKHLMHTFEKPEGYGNTGLFNISDLMKRESELVPCNVLTLVCKMNYPVTTENTSLSKRIKAQCSYCKAILEANENISSHERKCMDKPVKCPECGDISQLKNWYDHECQIAGTEASEKLLNDLKGMMLSGDHSDIIIKVKGEDFRLHKNILAARNPYFHCMFKNDMKEKATGIVTIDDCEPDVFCSFIHFVYTGKVNTLSSEIVCDLYRVADKYQEDQLKEQCSCFMMRSMSVDNLCDFIILALRHDENKLLQKATEFFCGKAKEIIRTVKWHAFLAEFPTQANELYIKALDCSVGK